MYAHLWAEDGTLFFPDALEFGFGSLFRPYAGYHHFFPRVIVLLALAFPLRFFASIVSAVAFITMAYVASLFSRTHYRWIQNSDVARFCVCLGVCGAPGLFEVLGNLANIHNVLLVFIGIILLRPLKVPISRIDWIVMFFALGSDGASLAYFPAGLLRNFLSKKRGLSSHDNVFLSLLAIWQVCHLVALLGAQQKTAHPHLSELVIASYYVGVQRIFIMPMFGVEAARRSMQHKWLLLALSTPLLATCRILRRRFQELSLLIAAVVFAPLCVYVATWISRPGSLAVFLGSEAPMYRTRYAFLMAPFALIFLSALADFSVFCRTEIKRPVRWYFALFFCLAIMPWKDFFLGLPLGPRLNWQDAAWRMEKARREKRCETLVFPEAPPGWNVVYRPALNHCAKAE